MSKRPARPGKLVTVRVTPAVAAKLEADARKARAFNKGIDAAIRAVQARKEANAGDTLALAVLANVGADLLRLRKPEG